MSERSINEVLKEYFSKSGKSEWEKIATSETNGKDPFDFLSWRGKDEIFYLPYYDADDVADRDLAGIFQIPPSENLYSGARSWFNIPSVSVSDEKTANIISLNHLANGADGVLFNIHAAGINLDQLMHKIEWPHCFIAFRTNDSTFPGLLKTFINNNFDPASLQGAFFSELIPKKNELDFYFDKCVSFQSLGMVIPSSSPVQEICDALLRGVKTFDTLTTASRPETVFRAITFSLSVDASFIETIAKLKALRMLWYQVARAYGYDNYALSDLHLCAAIDLAVNGAYAPHENMLKNAFAAMAAILGGCDSLTIETPQEQPVMSRISRNVSTILREESFFDKVADPVAGSYALDKITNEMADKAWAMFQLKCQHS